MLSESAWDIVRRSFIYDVLNDSITLILFDSLNLFKLPIQYHM